MSEQLPSDRLSMLKQRATEFLQRSSAPYRSMSVPIEQLIGLIECAEIVHTDYLLLSPGEQMKALKALKELGL